MKKVSHSRFIEHFAREIQITLEALDVIELRGKQIYINGSLYFNLVSSHEEVLGQDVYEIDDFYNVVDMLFLAEQEGYINLLLPQEKTQSNTILNVINGLGLSHSDITMWKMSKKLDNQKSTAKLRRVS